MKKILLAGLFSIVTCLLIAQDAPVQFSYDIKDVSATEKVLVVKSKGLNGAKIVSKEKNAAEAFSGITFDAETAKFITGDMVEKGTAGKVLDNPDVKEFNITAFDEVEWEQKITLKEANATRIKGKANVYYYATDGAVNSTEFNISKQVAASTATVSTAQPNAETAGVTAVNNVDTTKKTGGNNPSTADVAKKSLLALFFMGFIAGLIGFVTPCVYALVPVTVSMFMKRSKTKAQGRKNVLMYAAFIMIIYALVGLMTGVFFSNDDLQKLSANWIFNLAIFTLFVVFGLSFLGWFEISLPSSWSTKMDSKANTTSYLGIFFMALTLVIVSFSCTGPFVGTVLGASFTAGKIAPALGMLGFGAGLAAPFAIFAVFPNLITVLTKSGGWQNALKVTLGFVELAAALKFLSQADLIKGWRILDREVFIVLWIVIFLLLTMYLLGKLKFKLDSDLPKNDFGLEYLPVPRLLLAMTSLAFVVYLIPGLWGAPLKAVSGFVPPMGTQDFNLNKSGGGAHSAATTAVGPQPIKWVTDLKKYEPDQAIANNLTVFYDFEEAKAAAKAQKKPLLVDMTGITCVNCRKFEGAIWPNPDVAKAMKEEFVIASIYLDAPQELDDKDKKKSEKLGRTIETLGDYNKDIALNLIGSETMPNYLFLGDDGKLLIPEGYGYEPSENAKAFFDHMQKAKSIYKTKFP